LDFDRGLKRWCTTARSHMYKIVLSLATLAITIVWLAGVDDGCVVDLPRARQQADVIAQEIQSFKEAGHSPQEEGRLVKIGGVWITAKLPARGYGPDADADLAARMRGQGWSAVEGRPRVYCKNGIRAALERGQNSDSGWSMVTTVFDSVGLAPAAVGAPARPDCPQDPHRRQPGQRCEPQRRSIAHCLRMFMTSTFTASPSRR